MRMKQGVKILGYSSVAIIIFGILWYLTLPHGAGKVSLPIADFKGYGDKTSALCTEAYKQAVLKNPSYVNYRKCNVKWDDKGQPSIELSK